MVYITLCKLFSLLKAIIDSILKQYFTFFVIYRFDKKNGLAKLHGKNKYLSVQILLILCYLHRKLNITYQCFLVSADAGICGLTWWGKSENPRKTTDFGLPTTTLSFE